MFKSALAVGLVGLVALEPVAVQGVTTDGAVVSAEPFAGYRNPGGGVTIDGDSHAYLRMNPIPVTVSASGQLLLEASFQYRTEHQARFLAEFALEDAESDQVVVLPATRALGAAERGTSTTLQFLARDVEPGTYEASIWFDIKNLAGTRAEISAGQVILSGSPAQ
jgi:hypothetical protein